MRFPAGLVGPGRVCAFLLICAVLGTTYADDDHEMARALVESGDILPLDVILEKAQAHHRGRVLEVELEQDEGRRIYEIEIVDKQGVVHELYLDASSGELLKAEQEP